MPEETVVTPASLNNAQRGQLAELIFIRKAASLGFAVAKPWNEGERYDVIVRFETRLWRVQVKSVLAKSPSRSYYCVGTVANRNTQRGPVKTYSTAEIDFLVAYIFPEDLWYVFPAARVVTQKSVCLSPGSKRSKFEQYREAWHLMRSAEPIAEMARGAVAGT